MNIIESLRQFITVQLLNNPDMQIANDDDLLISGLLDSLGIMRLIGYIEDELFNEKLVIR